MVLKSVYYKPYISNSELCSNFAELVEGTARIIEARLKREVAEGKIVDFWRTDRGYEFIRLEALNGRENKVGSALPYTACCVIVCSAF